MMRAGYFSLSQRDEHHWDISNGERRIFAIRGEPGNISIRDERGGLRPSIGPFNSVMAAMTWVCDLHASVKP